MRLPDGTLLQGGRYRIDSFIAAGGFGNTYRGTHTLLGNAIAIKEFYAKRRCRRDVRTMSLTVDNPTDLPIVEKLRSAFIDEARALAAMHHNGIVRVHDVFEENGTAYYVMDYIDGTPLSNIIARRGHLTPGEALPIIRKVAAALEYVHSKGRLHLDIKPANIMITAAGNPVLIDFGASKMYTGHIGTYETDPITSMTPGFSPIEQMENRWQLMCPATDVYALSATLYFMLSGNIPPSAKELSSGTELPQLPAHVSGNVREAITAGMAIDIDRRIPTASALMEMINSRAVCDTAEDVAPMPRKKRSSSRWLPLFLAPVITACFVTAFVVMRNRRESTPPQPPQSTARLGSAKVTDMRYTDPRGMKLTYTGDVIDSVPNGRGEGDYRDGSRFSGIFISGIPNEGTLTYPDGAHYFIGLLDKQAHPYNGVYVLSRNASHTDTLYVYTKGVRTPH